MAKQPTVKIDEILRAATIAVKNRLVGKEPDSNSIRSLTRLFREIIRLNGHGDDQTKVLIGFVQESYQHLYPSNKYWEGSDLNQLLDGTCRQLDEIASGRPVHRDALHEVDEFLSDVSSRYLS